MLIMDVPTDGVQVVYEGDTKSLKAATLDYLVTELVDKFSSVDGSFEESQREFIQTFLQMHKWFTTSCKLFSLLAQKSGLDKVTLTHGSFRKSSDDSDDSCEASSKVFSDVRLDALRREASEPSVFTRASGDLRRSISHSLTGEELSPALKQRLEESQERINRKVCFTIRYWMQKFPLDFDSDSTLYAELQELKDCLYDEYQELFLLLDPSSMPSYAWMRKLTAKTGVPDQAKSQISLVFQNLDAEELAKHLTYIDFKCSQRISITDYEKYARSGSLANIACLERSITTFNGLTQWVQLMVLSKTSAKQRASIVTKFVRVSQNLLKLNNFNSLMAVIGGITHSSLARLHKTNNHLTLDTQKNLSELSALISSANNFQTYRKLLSEKQQNSQLCLPIIGVHLKDLIAIHSGQLDIIQCEPALVNFRKMSQLSHVLTLLTKLQDEGVPFEVNRDLVDLLKLALDVFYSEEEIFELSVAHEPRTNGVCSPVAANKNIFSDWLSGVKPPDQTTIDKHINNMVVALFKNYDTDKDGFISLEEFETIAGNFPFIESFCVLDSDNDGLLSEEEIKKYFLLAKCNTLKNPFKHSFTETTYFRPAYCEHCSGILWGLIKQGFKCKDCGISAHKSCKDIVVTECRSKPPSNSINKSTSMVMPHSPMSPPTTPDGYSREEQRFTFAPIRKHRFRHLSKGHSKQKSTQTDGNVFVENTTELSTSDSSKLSLPGSHNSRLQPGTMGGPQLAPVLQSDSRKVSDIPVDAAELQATLERQNEELKVLRRRLGMMRRYTITLLPQSYNNLSTV